MDRGSGHFREPPRCGAAGRTAGRVVCLDPGSVRVGVALSDSARTVATPERVVRMAGDAEADLAMVCSVVEETGATQVVVGVPVSLDGTEGAGARSARRLAASIAARLAVPVATWDERFTTGEAERGLRAAGSARSRRRALVDAAAAAVCLQSWLDAEKAGR